MRDYGEKDIAKMISFFYTKVVCVKSNKNVTNKPGTSINDLDGRIEVIMKNRWMCILLAGSMLLGFSGCGQQVEEEKQPVLVREDEDETFATVVADYGDIVQKASIKGVYTATEEVNHAFPADNKLIEKVYVKSGDYVEEGDLLIALDVDHLEAEIEERQYQVDSLALQLSQTRELYEFDLASAETLFNYTYKTDKDKEALAEQKESIENQYRNSLEDMEDKLAIAEDRLAQYKKDWEEGHIYAKIAGQITFLASPLEFTYSSEGTTVATISSLESCVFLVEDAEYADYFTEGEAVTITYREKQEQKSCQAYPAHMEQWDDTMEFVLAENEIMNNGVNGTIEVELESRENVLCIPKKALHESDKGPFVYLAKDGLLEMRYVTVGLEGDTTVEITDGLEQGEQVALKN